MKKILWVGDAGCPSGFARATHEILNSLDHRLGGSYEVTILGMNYRGDPHGYPYPIYAAAPGGDSFGVGRLIWMCDLVKPDLIVLQNDGWNLQAYVQQLRRKLSNGDYAFPEYAGTPIVAAVAVDGKNFRPKWLDGIAHTIFWTEFALAEAREAGFKGSAEVIPLGVDLSTYAPIADKMAVRKELLPEALHKAFIIGNVNRNQPRKRWDLSIRYFANWIKSKNVRDAYLYFHSAPTGDMSIDVQQLASYYGVVDRLALVVPPVWYGPPDEAMAAAYNCFDLQISTTQGEGFGLTTFEGMACGVPQIVPDWSALGELCKGAAWMVPCTSVAITNHVNVLGGVADEAKFVAALDALYRNERYRETNRKAGLERVEEPRFRWANVGKRWVEALEQVLNPVAIEADGHKVLQATFGTPGSERTEAMV